MAATADIKHDLRLRKIPLSRLIYRAAFEQNVEPIVIREQLAAHLKVSNARRSQIENILATEKESISKEHINGINAYFTKLLKEEVRVEAEVKPIGLFAG